MFRKILAISLLINIGFFQGAVFAEDIVPAFQTGPLQHMAIYIPTIPKCPPSTTWSPTQRTCIN